MTIALGIDLGVTGAIAAVRADGTARVHDLPVLDGRLQARPFVELLHQLVHASECAIVAVEDVRPRPANGGMRQSTPTSQLQLLGMRGACDALLQVFDSGLDVRYVQPQSWKRAYGLLRSSMPRGTKDSAIKAASLAAARRLYPDAPLGLAKHHNRAEALLLAHYALTVLA